MSHFRPICGLLVATLASASLAAEWRLAEFAQSQQNLAAARLQHELMKQEALQQLAAEGHASVAAVQQATQRVTSLQADVARWSEAVTATRQHAQREVVTARRWLIVDLPGLSEPEHPGYQLVIPIARRKRISIDSPRDQPTTRSDALAALQLRLADMPGANGEAELRWTQARRDIATATDQQRACRSMGVWVSSERRAGDRLVSDHQLQQSVWANMAIARSEQREALQRMVREQLQQQAAVVLQQPTAFSPIEQFRLERQLSELAVLPSSASPFFMTSNATHSAARPRPLRAASALLGQPVNDDQLAAVLTSLDNRRQMLTEEHRRRNLVLDVQQGHWQQLKELTSVDTSVATEAEWSHDRLAWATAQSKQRQLQLQMLDLAEELVQGLRFESDPPDGVRRWTATLKDLLQRRDLSAEVCVLQAERQLEQRRLTALETLHDEGCASWKEVTRSEVRIAELDQDLAWRQAQQHAYRVARSHVRPFVRTIRTKPQRKTATP